MPDCSRYRANRRRTASAIQSVSPPVSRMAKRRYSLRRARPSSKTTMLATTSVPWMWRDVEALDAQRRVVEAQRLLDLGQGLGPGAEVARPLELVLGQRLRGVAADRLQQRPLVAALRHPQPDPGPATLAEPLGERLDVLGQFRDEDLRAESAVDVGVAVDLGGELLDQVAGGADLLDLVDRPAALAAHPTAADVEHLHGGLQLVLGEGRRRRRRCRRRTPPPASPSRRRNAVRSSRSRAARSKSSSAAATAICFSSRRIIVSVWPAMKSQKSSTICRCSSAVTRPTQGAEHLPM